MKKLLYILLLLITTASSYSQFEPFDWLRKVNKVNNVSLYSPIVSIDTTTYPLTPYGNGWLVFNGVSQFARSRCISYVGYQYSLTDTFKNAIKFSVGLPRKPQYIAGMFDGANVGWAWGYGNVMGNRVDFRLWANWYGVDTLSVSDSTFHTYEVVYNKSTQILRFYVDGTLNATYTSVTYANTVVTNAFVIGHAVAPANYADPTSGTLSPSTHFFLGKIDYIRSDKYCNGVDSSALWNFNEGDGQVMYDSVTYMSIDATTPDGYRGGAHTMNGWTNARDSQDVQWSRGTAKTTTTTTALGTGLWNWSTPSAAYIGGFTNGLTIYNGDVVPTTAFNRVNVIDGVWTNNTDTASDVARFNGTWSKIGTNGSLFPSGSITQGFDYGDSLVVVGSFTNIGSASGDYVLMYNRSTWGAMASGFDNSAYTINYYNGKIIVGGAFNNAGAVSIPSGVAQWDYNAWSSVGTNDIGEVWALDTFRTSLYAGTSQGLYRLRGNTWDLISSFNGSTIFCLQWYHNQLWYGGTNGMMGFYDGQINSMGVVSGFANSIIEFTTYGNDLYAAGSFYRIFYNNINTVCNKLVRYNGDAWSAINYGVDQRPEDLAVWNHNGTDSLVVTGDLYYADGVGYNNIFKMSIPYTSPHYTDTATYQVETIEYYNRVIADGGTVISLQSVDTAIVNAKNNGYWGAIRCWYDPEFGIKKSGADSVMKLYDLFGYDLIGTGGATYTANSINTNPSLVFNGTNDYFTSSDISSGLTAVEVFIVGRRDADPPSPDALTGFWKYGNNAEDSHVPYSDGTIYDDFGSSARKTVGNPTPSLANLFLYNVSSASSNFTARINGSQLYNTGTNTFGLKSAPILGKSLGAYYYKGKFGAMIILNAVATTNQRNAIQNYLNSRYIIY